MGVAEGLSARAWPLDFVVKKAASDIWGGGLVITRETESGRSGETRSGATRSGDHEAGPPVAERGQSGALGRG